MKKYIIPASFLALAATMFTACEKENYPAHEQESGTITVVAKAAGPVDSRTVVTPDEDGKGYQVVWDTKNKETVRIFYMTPGAQNGLGNNGNDNNVVITVQEDDNTVGTFTINNKKTIGETKVWVLYPAAASRPDQSGKYPFLGKNNDVYTVIAPIQHPVNNGPDHNASIMFATFDYPNSNYNSTQAEFKHVVAYGKLNFKNIENLEGDKITSVKFTVNDSDAKVAGNCTLDAQTFQFKDVDGEPVPGQSVTLNWQDDGVAKDTDSHDIWFAMIPSYGEAYSSFDIEVTLDSGKTYTKHSEPAGGVKFNVGRVRPINVDMLTATEKK